MAIKQENPFETHLNRAPFSYFGANYTTAFLSGYYKTTKHTLPTSPDPLCDTIKYGISALALGFCLFGLGGFLDLFSLVVDIPCALGGRFGRDWLLFLVKVAILAVVLVLVIVALRVVTAKE